MRRVITSEREARSEFLLTYTKNLSMSGPPAGPPWLRFWEAYISGAVSPIDKRSSFVQGQGQVKGQKQDFGIFRQTPDCQIAAGPKSP